MLEEQETKEMSLAEPEFVKAEDVNRFRKFKLTDCKTLC